MTKNCIEVYNQSGGTYNVNKEVKCKTHQLRSDLCDWNNSCLVVTGKITVTNPDDGAYDRELALKNKAPFLIVF